MSFFINIRDVIYYNRKIIFGISLILIILIFYIYNANESIQVNSNYNNDIILNTEESKKNSDEEEVLSENLYVVDIKGCIKNPGTYEISKEKRIIDVINMAGGLLEESDVSKINLSKKIIDEMMIVIPSKNDILNNTSSSTINDTNIDTYVSSSNDGKISLNTADLSLLMTINGIGEVKAKAILEYRNTHGRFNKIEDIMNISGIKEGMYEKIAPYITVS